MEEPIISPQHHKANIAQVEFINALISQLKFWRDCNDLYSGTVMCDNYETLSTYITNNRDLEKVDDHLSEILKFIYTL